MECDEFLNQVIVLLQRQGRVSYGTPKRRFHLDDDYLQDLKVELIEAQGLAADEQRRILVWLGSPTVSRRRPIATTPRCATACSCRCSMRTTARLNPSRTAETARARRGGREREERRRQRQEMLPAVLSLDTTMQIADGGVVMVTYDPTRRRLVAITGGSQASR